MSGVKLLVDTNVIIKHLSGDKKAERTLQDAVIYISSITYAELLAGDLTSAEEEIRATYISQTHIIHTNDFICEAAAKLRKTFRIKLPDAFIAATAIFLQLPVVTFDSDFDSINHLQVIKLTV